MTDRERFELEMSPGAPPPSGLGDRILVGLAVVALAGGLLIAVGNVLKDNAELAQASEAPSSAPVRTPRPSPTPRPPRVVTLQQPDGVTVREPQATLFSGWIRANVDLVIRASPVPDGVEVGVLPQGGIAYADQQGEQGDRGWLYLRPPQQGWIATVEGETQLVQRYQQAAYPTSAYVASLTAGPDGFVALARPPGDGVSYQSPYPMASTDGAEWRAAGSSAFGEWEVAGIAWGPAGWLAASNVSGPSQSEIWLWASHNGSGWSPLGVMAGAEDEFAVQILASNRGYLLATDARSRGGGITIWTSADGLTWRESVDPVLHARNTGWIQTVAVQAGFYRWDIDPENLASLAAFSADGQSWTTVEGGPRGSNLPMTSIEDRLLAIDADPQSSAPRVWSASVAADAFVWSRERAADEAFGGAVVTQLVSDGERAFAFGWDRSTEEPLVWTGDGPRWLRSPLPDSFGGLPQMAAAGPAGVVVVGHRPTLRGDNPIFWHRTASGRWLPDAQPVLAAVPDPSIDECPAVASDFLAFFVLDRAAATLCFGDAPITFRAWSERCSECFPTAPGVARPEWLLRPTTNQLYLSPIEGDGDWSTSVVVGPFVAMDPAWAGAWLEVTGHFDDPAAATCHWEPTQEDLPYWSGQQSVMDACRQIFVVTEVTVVESP